MRHGQIGVRRMASALVRVSHESLSGSSSISMSTVLIQAILMTQTEPRMKSRSSSCKNRVAFTYSWALSGWVEVTKPDHVGMGWGVG